MRAARIAAGGALLGAAGLIVLLTLPREARAAPPPIAALERGSRAGSARLVVRPDAFADPRVRGVCLLFDEGRPRGGSAASWDLPAARGTIRLRAGETVTSYDIVLGRGEYRLCLPTPGLTTGPVSRIDLDWIDADPPDLDRVEPLELSTGEPVPADLGVILAYRKADWRDRDYEVFRWSREPSILIFDTSDYAVQDRLFKRLAFFVEKKGYAGTIPDFAAIAGLHGFNAHDYRAEDLARFYRYAAGAGRELLPEEIALRDILLREGVILRSGSTYAAGQGGVLSISRDSAPELRRRLLAHEALHGVYFTDQGFRSGVARVWESASEDLRQFFRLYLSWPDWGYDVDNTYLVTNEFLAYMLQYPEADARAELFVAGCGWLEDRYPRRASWVRDFRRDGESGFLRAWRDLEIELYRATGIGAATLVALGPAGTLTPR